MLSTLLKLRDQSGKSFLHKPTNLFLAKILLERAKSLDETCESGEAKIWQRLCLLQADEESGYTPFHYAILEGDLASILLYLRHAMDSQSTGRLAQSPMAVLHGNNSSDLLIQEMISSVDKEGLTPLELMGRLQISELATCRKQLLASPEVLEGLQTRPRQSSFDDDGQQELTFLTEHLDLLESEEEKDEEECTYACEVVTFGRPHHSGLGVASAHGEQSAFRPQRVQDFAQDTVGRDGSAVAVAAATHHTLVATKNGTVYAFGLGKGGRLGLGEDVQQCPLPRCILGPLARRKVVGVAAAENHSLCVTKDGALFAWGSNRFGQLGLTETKAAASQTSKGQGTIQGNFLPRRVEDLRNIPCIAVAAGEKHSVALTRRGEVYVWGDNGAFQLGVPRRSGIQKVQRVEALWNSTPPKVAIAISAAEHSTLVLSKPIKGITRVNSVYSWGHGNYVPIRVQFDDKSTSWSSDGESLSSKIRRVVNPVAIACAKYHNAAITSDGHVFTWGLHAESLGRSNAGKQQRNSTGGRSTSSPQLVTGMLPENGGGIAVALSASDQHTAVVTECGALYTWGTTYGNNVLGHEGVKWQPSPKRVPCIHRAVNVAVAKEHTVLLIGSSFPRIPEPPQDICSSLELVAARKVAEHVDLFNVIPILIMAERSACPCLIEYCMKFIYRNLDGVINMGKKSEMNQYLNDMLADSLHRSGKPFRDERHHPFIFDVITAGNKGRPTFDREWVSNTEQWLRGCTELSELRNVQKLIATLSTRDLEKVGGLCLSGRSRRALSFSSETTGSSGRARSLSFTSDQGSNKKNASEKREGSLDKCIKKTANMDLSTSELAKENSVWLNKEIRGVRKKLNQIRKLKESEERETNMLSIDEKAKVDRRPILEAELCVYETALVNVENRIKELVAKEKVEKQRGAINFVKKSEQVVINEDSSDSNAKDIEKKTFSKSDSTPEEEKVSEGSFSCLICNIKCPDQTSYELHKNGRKHRNRVAQVAEEEKTKAAASLMEKHQLHQVKGRVRQALPAAKPMKNAWGVSSSSKLPKYTLPPPPHPVTPPVTQVPIVASSSPWMTTSDSCSPSGSKFSVASTPKKSPSLVASTFTKVTNKRESANANAATPKDAGLSLGSPICHSVPASSRRVPLSVYSSPTTTSTLPQEKNVKKYSYSLADLLAPKPDVNAKSPCAKTWSSPQAKTSANRKSFAEIQAEEVDFKSRQDKSYEKGGGTWFIERRERANSLHEIQNSARKEQEELEFIEEQKRIEEQIQNELALQRKHQNQQKNRTKKKGGAPQNKKHNNGNKGGRKNISDTGKSNGKETNIVVQEETKRVGAAKGRPGEGVGNSLNASKANKPKNRRNTSKKVNKKKPARQEK